MQEAADLGHGEEALLDSWTMISVTFSDDSKFCISFGSRGSRGWKKAYEAEKLSFTKSNIKFSKSTMVCGGMSTAGVGPLRVFCKQMSLLLSIKKTLSILCLQRLSNCLEVTNSHSHTIWRLPIMPNPERRGLPCMGYRSCLDWQTLRILIPSKIF